MTLCNQDTSILPPFPAFDTPGCKCISLASLFLETAPGHFEAAVPSDLLCPLCPDGHFFLYLNRVGCRARLTALNESGMQAQRTHYGSYTDWCMEITSLLSDSRSSLHLVLELKSDEQTLSPYQKAGILGDILFLSLPRAYLTDFYIRPVCCKNSRSFLISCPVNEEAAGTGSISLEITADDPLQNRIGKIVLPVSRSCSNPVSLCVPNPLLWSPDSPNLYLITVTILYENTVIGSWQKKAGLCSIEKNGQQILLNGSPLKLKGLAYREPLASEGFDCKEDLRLFSDAGVNYLRSLCYPFSTQLLELCDEQGILVEQSAPVDGVGQNLPANQNAPALRPLFLGQYREMLLRDRSHPCILLWCLGNESVWGDQFRQELSLTRQMDPDRLANFHLPMTIPQEEWIPDVWSVQYGAWNLKSDVCYDQMVIFHTQGAENAIGYALGEAQDYCLPVLHDAFAPVPLHDLDDLERDPGVHDFWGESMERFWSNIRSTPGALGGAVMAAVDEDGSFHPSLTGFARGVLDASHRPKPEYWHLKMAYREDPFTVTKEPELWIVENSRIRCLISPAKGLITGIWADKEQVVCCGPFLHTGRFVKGSWKPDTAPVLHHTEKGICLTLSGSYGSDLSAVFTLHFTEDGLLTTDCQIMHLGRPMPHQVKSGIGLDPGGLDELGIRYLLPASMDTLSWSRRSLHHTYPANHIGRPRGIASRSCISDFTSMKANITDACISSANGAVRILPSEGQSLRLQLTPDSRCMLDDRENGNTLANLSWEGSWYQIDDRAGGEYATETMSNEKNAACIIQFQGTGIVLYGSSDRIRGCCDIWIDGQKAASGISQHTPAVQFACMSRGYEKRSHTILFQTDSLPEGEHTCRIEVTGEKEPQAQDTYISLDSFEILHPDYPRQVSLLICRDYNYPRLVMGNYMRPPVLLKEGDTLTCSLCLCETAPTTQPSHLEKGGRIS